MSVFFYIYTMAVLVVCIVAAISCIAAFVVTHRKRNISKAGFFIFYFLELATILGAEWAGQNSGVVDAANFYAIDEPFLRIVLGAGILFSFWVIVLDILDAMDWRPVVISTIVVVVAQVVILLLMDYGPLRQWLFYAMRQLSIAACLVFALVVYLKNRDNEVFQQRMHRRIVIYAILWVLLVCIELEDTYIIFFAPIPDGGSDLVGYYLSSRNISENLMALFMAVIVLKRAWGDLSLRFTQPPQANEADPRQTQNLLEHIDDRLPRFAQQNGLSAREAEVLGHALEGKSNREIASELILAEGTVKTHLHNIMKKCGVSNREELKQKFWSQ